MPSRITSTIVLISLFDHGHEDNKQQRHGPTRGRDRRVGVLEEPPVLTMEISSLVSESGPRGMSRRMKVVSDRHWSLEVNLQDGSLNVGQHSGHLKSYCGSHENRCRRLNQDTFSLTSVVSVEILDTLDCVRL
ncbi:hypothetical protein TCAL_15339 [Tigriopus californicus]|uniref:Uncharacterized protein n=1 Tax=Tigriopus californicus TaxID=6832 RepID=A0A553PKE4_TIGCA|nr:hypothetical protein TCAL_15339 [Tigriopus californicus]